MQRRMASKNWPRRNGHRQVAGLETQADAAYRHRVRDARGSVPAVLVTGRVELRALYDGIEGRSIAVAAILPLRTTGRDVISRGEAGGLTTVSRC
ncbi:hypothetical protein CHELA17_64732 [Chelatococcus asaccharovorans]|nr:hypothetical protein CHELA17_64732 [Chelatococcus asaccharovorans]